MLILNDIHLGFFRAGGTTIASREAARDYLHTSLQKTLDETTETHLVIAGDLFDDFEVTGRDWMAAFCILYGWINGGGELTLIAGNHDHSPKANKVSAFEMLCQVLKQQSPDSVHVVPVDSIQWIATNVVAVAHCSNQDIFDLKLKEVLDTVNSQGDFVILHANFDNNFAAQSDHSLNVSRAVAHQFAEKKVRLLFAHEHQAKVDIGGNVYVMGNQWPTSVADCLGNDNKFAHIITGDVIHSFETWNRDSDAGYEEVPWQNLSDMPELTALEQRNTKFVKVIGEATANQASEVMNAIAKFRQKSSAFVVTNGVKVDGIVAVEDLPDTFEAAKAFDIIDFIKKHLDVREFAVVCELMDWDAPVDTAALDAITLPGALNAITQPTNSFADMEA
jgi:metallophosphoesterase superfamily enzyme